MAVVVGEAAVDLPAAAQRADRLVEGQLVEELQATLQRLARPAPVLALRRARDLLALAARR